MRRLAPGFEIVSAGDAHRHSFDAELGLRIAVDALRRLHLSSCGKGSRDETRDELHLHALLQRRVGCGESPINSDSISNRRVYRGGEQTNLRGSLEDKLTSRIQSIRLDRHRVGHTTQAGKELHHGRSCSESRGVTMRSQNTLQSMEASHTPLRHWPVVPTILVIWIAFLIAIAACFANGIGW